MQCNHTGQQIPYCQLNIYNQLLLIQLILVLFYEKFYPQLDPFKLFVPIMSDDEC